MADGTEKPIELVRPGDRVMSRAADGLPTAGVVGKLYRNVTTEWLVLRAADGSTDRLVELTCTPGHWFRRPDGSFMQAEQIVAGDGLMVWKDGSTIQVTHERVAYSAESAHLYERAEKVVYPTQGGLALKPETVEGWRTLNFEVLEHHNYIAGGVQVHNDSSPTLAIAAADFYNEFGFDFDGSNKAHLDLLMGAISDGDIKAYGDYVGNLSDDRYTATFYDAAKDKIVATFGETETIFTTVRDGVRETVTRYKDGTEIAVSEERWDRDGGHEVDHLFADGRVDVREMFLPDGRRAFAIDFGSDERVARVEHEGLILDLSDVGSAFGSALGRAIGGDNLFAGLAASTVLGAVMKNLGQGLTFALNDSLLAGVDGFGNRLGAATELAFADFGVDLKNAAYANVTGALSSFLMGELAENMGLEGMGAGVFTTAGNAVTSQLLGNLGMMAGILEVPSAAYQFSLDTYGVFAGFDTGVMAGNLANAFGAYFGSELAGSLIRAETPEAAMFASAATAIASAAGGAIGAAIGGAALSWIPVVGTFIGAFLGRLVGTWAGNAIFDDDQLAGATVGYDPLTDAFRIVGGRVWDGGDFTLAQAMADNVIATLNDVLATTGAQVDESAPPGTVEVGYYTNHRGWKYAFADGLQEFYSSRHGTIDAALTHAAVYATEKMLATVTLQGGDPMLARAYHASRDKGLAQLGLDLKVAQDYARYLEDVSLINALIAAEPGSEFAAGWIVTLQRAHELGLDRPFHAGGVEEGNRWATTTVNGRLVDRACFDEDGNEAWATVADGFDARGQHTSRITTNDDGSRKAGRAAHNRSRHLADAGPGRRRSPKRRGLNSGVLSKPCSRFQGALRRVGSSFLRSRAAVFHIDGRAAVA